MQLTSYKSTTAFVIIHKAFIVSGIQCVYILNSKFYFKLEFEFSFQFLILAITCITFFLVPFV